MRVGRFVLLERSKANGQGPVALHAPQAQEAAKPDMREIGALPQSSYSSLFLGEYNTKLFGQMGLEQYDKMRKGDGKVRAVLRAVKAPLLAAQWHMEPASEEQEAVDQAEFAWWALNNAADSFTQFLSEVLLMFDFGHSLFEKVFEYDDWTPLRKGANTRRVVTLKKLASRHPRTISEWKYDTRGELIGVEQERIGANRAPISASKLLVFTLDEEGGDHQGISLLRSMYKHWYYKENLYKVDAIQKERHGIGIPDITLAQGYSADDKRTAEELGRNLRTNEKAYIVRPHTIEVGFVELKGQPVNILDSIAHHDLMIAVSGLAEFLNLGATETGSRAVATSQTELFVKALRYLSDLIRAVINRFVIEELIRFNWGPQKAYPVLKVRRIGEEADWRGFAVAIRNLIEPGALSPDSPLEAFIREVMGLPKASQKALDRDIEERRTRPETPGQEKQDKEGSRTGGPVE